jgi:hypothetical protein
MNTENVSNEAEKPALNKGVVASRTFKCLKCKNYSIKVVNENGGTAKVCNAKINDPRIIVDLDAPKCTDYVYGW